MESGMHGLFPGLTLERNLTISSVDRMCQWSDPFRLERAVAVDTAGTNGYKDRRSAEDGGRGRQQGKADGFYLSMDLKPFSGDLI